MTLHELLNSGREKLASAGVSNSYFEAEWLAEALFELSRVELLQKAHEPVKEIQVQKFQTALRKRLKGMPLAYVINRGHFFGRDFFVDKRVLIPRPETELIVALMLKAQSKLPLKSPQILDLGTGSGCIGITLALEIADAQVTLVDISQDAIEVAKINAHQLAPEKKIDFVVSDVSKLETAAPINLQKEKFDWVVMNPPYIKNSEKLDASVQEYEPHGALFGGVKGFELVQDWLRVAHIFLRPGGRMVTEIGYDQGPLICEFLRASGAWSDVELFKDFSEHDRIVSAQKKDH